MKLFIVTILLAVGLLGLIVSIDLIMGISTKGIVWKALNPFRVMETAEYIIVLIFIIFFLLVSLGAYLNKSKKNNNNKNKDDKNPRIKKDKNSS